MRLLLLGTGYGLRWKMCSSVSARLVFRIAYQMELAFGLMRSEVVTKLFSRRVVVRDPGFAMDTMAPCAKPSSSHGLSRC